MTQPQAEALAAKLTRIWELAHSELAPASETSLFLLKGVLNPKVCRLEDLCFLRVENVCGKLHFKIRAQEAGLVSWEQDWRDGFFADKAKQARFTREWLPLFRRNCALSGCAVEATLTERREWMLAGRKLGLSEEELIAITNTTT